MTCLWWSDASAAPAAAPSDRPMTPSAFGS
jgi:hypothetical protein